MADSKEIRYHLPFPLFDTHFHALHMLERNEKAIDLLITAFDKGLTGAVEVAVDELGFEKRLNLCREFPQLVLSAGIHPSSTHTDRGVWEDRLLTIRKQAENSSVRAIGETGLDYYREHSPGDSQRMAFRDQLALAADSDLPVIIHNRNADEDVLSLLRASDCRKGILHCFSSDAAFAVAVVELGFHVSFAGNITYKKNEELKEAAKVIPSDRILIETDSPYLSPQKVRSRSNHPGHIGFTLEALAEIREMAPMELASQTLENAKELFRL